jgi:lipid-A-disaccharide synthase
VLQAGQTYQLLHRATAALVTSGTATLETCLLGVPQVVCYYTPLKHFIGMMKRMVLSVKYVSLVNLIANRQVVTELVADSFSVANVRRELDSILPDGRRRQAVLDGYREVATLLGSSNAPEAAATLMVNQLEAGRK